MSLPIFTQQPALHMPKRCWIWLCQKAHRPHTFLRLQAESGTGGLWRKHGTIVRPVRLEVGGQVVGTAIAVGDCHAPELASNNPLARP